MSVENGEPVVYYVACRDLDVQKAGNHVLQRWREGEGSLTVASDLQYIQALAAQDGNVTLVMDSDGNLERAGQAEQL